MSENAWRLLEAGMLFALVVGLTAHGPMRAAFRGLGAVRGGALLAIFGAVGAAQIADRPRWTYPFMRWSMYSHVDVTPEFTDYSATLESGGVIDFPFHKVIPTHEPRGLSTNFNRRLRRATGPGADSAGRRETVRLLRSLAEIHNDRYGDDPIRHIDIQSRSIPLHDFEGRESLVSRHLMGSTVPEPRR